MLLTRTEELYEFRNSGELSDICVVVNKIEFHLHKFPLFVKSEFFRALCRCGMIDEKRVMLREFPGGSCTFSLIADYCYGLDVDINSRNVVDLRCAAEFLQMTTLVSETTAALTRMLAGKAQGSSVVDMLLSAAKLGEIASHTNVLSHCFETVMILMKKHELSDSILEVLLELPVQWIVEFLIGARDAGISAFKISRLAGKYIEKMARKHRLSIDDYLKKYNSARDVCSVATETGTISVQDFGYFMDAILLELPKNALLSDVIDNELLCILYRVAVQLGCKCEGMLLSAFTNICSIPCEILVTMPTTDIVRIIEYNVNNNELPPTMLCTTIDSYLWERTKQKHISLEEFEAVVRAIPMSYRPQHDAILLIAEELFSSRKISEEMKLKFLAIIDIYQLHEETLKKVSMRSVIPLTFVTRAAFALSSRLRNELITAKALLAKKDDDIRKLQASVNDVIQGQWHCNDVAINVTTKDGGNTRVQFAKVIQRNSSGGLTMEHEVYDGKLTLCVQSRETSTQKNGTTRKKFLFDPFDDQLIEIKRSKHDNLVVGEHYEKKKHTSPYWPFMDCAS